MSHKVEDHMVLISQLYPVVFTQMVPQQGESKPQRRRKKNKDAGLSGAKKRKLSEEQVNLLEMKFGSEHKLESDRKDKLASELGLDPRQVAVWFQNRRERWKNKKLEEEYTKLKTSHETIVVEKCQLESETLPRTEPVVQVLEQSNAGLDNLSVDAGRTQVGVQGMEQGGEEGRVCSHLDMENTGEGSAQHVHRIVPPTIDVMTQGHVDNKLDKGFKVYQRRGRAGDSRAGDVEKNMED